MFKVSRKPPHRGGFVLPGVQRADAAAAQHPARAVKTPPRLPALCMENHADERLGAGNASQRQHWPRAR